MGKNTRVAQELLKSKEVEVLAVLRSRSRSLARKAASPQDPAIKELGSYKDYFVWEPEGLVLRTKSKNRDKQVVELVRRTFGKYPVCKALTSAWTRDPIGSTLAVDFRLWHICAAAGGSLYKVHAKAHLSKMEVHYLLRCPHDISIEQALCYCVCMAAGAGEGVAMRLARSKISEMPFDDFWRQVLRFFGKHPPASVSQADDLCDYVQHRQREGAENILTGQTLSSVERKMEGWHRDLQRARVLGNSVWAGREQPDDSFERRDPSTGKPVYWDFVQIKNSKDLAAEGSLMRHCVFSYKRSCVEGSLSIWSLSRREHFGFAVKKLTIELRSDGQIFQAKGLANRAPRPEELVALKTWAAKRNLHTRLF